MFASRLASHGRASTSAPVGRCQQGAAPLRPVTCRAPGAVVRRSAAEGTSTETVPAPAPAADAPAGGDQPIALTEAALSHLYKLREEVGSGDLMLRVGVKQGGCSGMSYTMDFIKDQAEVGADDMVLPYDGGSFKLVVDPKSLLYLFGMKLDYSTALIGGGFSFMNPNAVDTCGCGKSFGV